jgi:hypothetical protein
MINIVFSKMEAYSGNFGITLSKLQSRNSFIQNKPNSIDDGEISMKNSDKSLKVKKTPTHPSEEEKSNVSSVHEMSARTEH